jgi:hypothetical protein
MKKIFGGKTGLVLLLLVVLLLAGLPVAVWLDLTSCLVPAFSGAD